MTWSTWAVFLVAITTLCVAPGPAVLLVVSQALTRGTLMANWSILGIEAGNILYYAISATGVSAILLAPYNVFAAIKYLGAAYLVWLGIRTLLERSPIVSARAEGGNKRSAAQLFFNGFVLQMANPKPLLFYVALLPQFVEPARPVVRQMAILASTGIVVEFLVLSTYGHFATCLMRVVGAARFTIATRWLAGLILVIAGAGMAVIRRP